jgi:hypothetical protein
MYCSMEVGRVTVGGVNVSWLRQLIGGFLPRKPGFDSRSLYVRFNVDKLALAQVCFGVLQISPVSIIPPLLHTHPSIHLPPTLYNVFLPVLQFSPVSIIPQLFHTQSSIYHPRCIMFFSQYFSFPCQYHSTNVLYSSLS